MEAQEELSAEYCLYYCQSCREEVPPEKVYFSGKCYVHGVYDGGNAIECGPVDRLSWHVNLIGKEIQNEYG